MTANTRASIVLREYNTDLVLINAETYEGS